VFVQDEFNHHLGPRPRTLPQRPVDGPAKCECKSVNYEVQPVRHSKLLIQNSQAVTLHRLVGIHCLQARRVEAGQPHVAHDHNFEGVPGVLELVRQIPPLLLVADVLPPLWAVLGAASHHGFQRFFRPLGPQLDQRIVEFHTDAAAHADDHRLAVHPLNVLLEMRHQASGDERGSSELKAGTIPTQSLPGRAMPESSLGAPD